MNILLVEKWRRGHEPMFEYGGREGHIITRANHFHSERNVWVVLPDELIADFDSLNAPFITFGDGAIHPIADLLGNDGDWPVLVRPSPGKVEIVRLDILADDEEGE